MKVSTHKTSKIKVVSFRDIRTVGKLKEIISNFPNDLRFGFLNQSEQVLEYITRTDSNSKMLVFQEAEENSQFTEYSIELDKIIRVISEYTNVPVDVIKGKSRKRTIVDARFLYFSVAMQLTKASLNTVALTVNKDHGMVLYGCKNVKNIKDLAYQKREILIKYHKQLSF